MKTTWHKIHTLFAVYYANMVEYRAELYLWVIAGLLPFIMMAIWMKAAGTPGNTLGTSPAEVVRYFVCVFIVRQLSVVWVIWEFEGQVLQGRLSPYLLQPIDPVWRFVAMHISEQMARLPFSLAVMGAVLALYPRALWLPSPDRIVLAVLAIYMAFTVRFLIQYTTAMLCFWVERAAGVEQLMYLAYLFLSGSLAKLDYFPPVVRKVALWTPFPYLVYFPAQLLSGADHSGPLIGRWQGFGVMAFWIAAIYPLSRWVWHRGLRHYSAMGA
jgi:ABC-2 type transport system permease protein